MTDVVYWPHQINSVAPLPSPPLPFELHHHRVAVAGTHPNWLTPLSICFLDYEADVFYYGNDRGGGPVEAKVSTLYHLFAS